MLNIQQALGSGKTLEDLTAELAIAIHRHSDLPLIGLTYNQIDSPKIHPIVREARGIVLENNTWNVVGKAFNRFFNAGEVQEEYETFNWSRFTTTDKVDGSLILLFNYQDQWIAKTRGSFGEGIVPFPKPGESITFSQLFWRLSEMYQLSEKLSSLNPKHTYAFEMCSLYNKVVRIYREPRLFLLSIFNNEDFSEFSEDETSLVAASLGLERPQVYKFTSHDEIAKFLLEKQDTDPSYEGVVIRDDKNLRYKIKTETYLALHRMADNGALYSPKNLVPFALKEDPAELLVYFPEAKEFLDPVVAEINKEWEVLRNLWQETHQIGEQKSFAKAIVGKSRFASLLFELRKLTGTKIQGGFAPGPQTEQQLKESWRNSGDQIVKVLYK